MKAVLTDTITKLAQKYETRIQELETENNILKQELTKLKGTGAININAQTKNTDTPATITSATTKSDIRTIVMKQAINQLSTILRENNLPAYTAIGLLEFIEPNAVFLSLDDGKNPADILAFKTKILYTFDDNLAFTKIGVFDLDYASQKYRTVFGSNPYVKNTRIRVENAVYKGNLLEMAAKSNSVNNETKAPVISTANVATGEVTFTQIKAAYDKNKNLDVLKISDSYLLKNPSDIEVLRMRYRSYYFIGKYDNALTEIKKIETIQGSTFERTIACDAAVIGKIAKKTDVSAYYSTICKKK